MLDPSLRSDLLTKSLHDWQSMLGGLFGISNRAQGLVKVSEHLGKEITELAEAVVLYVASPNDATKLAASLECADVLAWLIAIANLLSIDLLLPSPRLIVSIAVLPVSRRSAKTRPTAHSMAGAGSLKRIRPSQGGFLRLGQGSDGILVWTRAAGLDCIGGIPAPRRC